jgi:hypothetical protein
MSDSRLVMELFTHVASRIKWLRTVGDLFRLTPPLAAEDARTHVIDPPVGFEALAVAISE